MQERDYYAILGISREASKDEIKDAFRKLALRYHPDRNKSDTAGAKFREISEAYAILSDDEKRGQYNQSLYSEIDSGYTSQVIYAGYQPDVVFREVVNAPKPDEPYLFPYRVVILLTTVFVLIAVLHLLGPALAPHQPYQALYYLSEVALAAVGVGYMIKSARKKTK